MSPEEWLTYVGSAVFGSLVILLLINIAKEFRGERSGDRHSDRRL